MTMTRRTLPSSRPRFALAAMTIALAFAVVAMPGRAQQGDEPRASAETTARRQAPWMGLRVTPVPEALAAHLPLDHGDGDSRLGLMVRNLVTKGPADKAGLERYDVIVAINDDPVLDAPGRFVRQVSRLKPGNTVKLSILRAGEPTTLKLTVGGSEPEASRDYAYRYPQAPTGVMQERRRFEGAVITRDESGWQWEDLDQADAEALADLPPEMLERLQRFADIAGPDAPTQRTVIQRGDRTVEIVRADNGRITVRSHRLDPRGEPQALVQTYGSVAAFRKGDPRAFQLQARLTDEPLLAAPVEGQGEPADGAAEGGGPEAAPDEPTDPRGDAPRDGEFDAYAAQREQYQAFLEQYTEYLRERMDDPDAEGSTPMPMMWRQILDGGAERALLPKREFSRDESGRIDVRIRKPSGDLVLSFRSAEAMKQKNPDLYKHYRALVEDQ